MANQYKSDVYAAIHQTMEDIYEVGLVDRCAMRKCDDSCLIPVEDLPPEEIRRIRESQSTSH